MSWKSEVDGIAERRRRAAELGGAEAVAAQRDRDRLTVRERIDRLLDAGSFREQGPIAGHSETDENGALRSFTPANYVLGLGTVDGRPCVVGGEDFTQRGGKLRVFNLIDECTRECHCIHADRSITAADVLWLLQEAIEENGPPEFIRSDNGPVPRSEATTKRSAHSLPG